VVLAGCTAAAPVLFGHPPLEANVADVHLPVFGDVHLSSTLAFDAGVYLVVVGLVLMIFEAFGDERTDSDGTGLATTASARGTEGGSVS
jgi:multicomponent Na+:H+ antiporter subunit A